MTILTKIPVLGFVGFSGSGKTTLLLKVLPLLKAQGLRMGMIKHAHHQFDIDYPEKDSFRLRKTGGVSQMLVASRQRWALIHELSETVTEPCLETLLKQLDHEQLDMILVEGFKHEAFPKLEVHRPSLGKPLLFPEDKHIVALVTDELSIQSPVPMLNLNEPRVIAEFLIQHFLVA